MVGAVRFELTTSCTRNKRASQATLRPDPRTGRLPAATRKSNVEIQRGEIQRRGFGLPHGGQTRIENWYLRGVPTWRNWQTR